MSFKKQKQRRRDMDQAIYEELKGDPVQREEYIATRKEVRGNLLKQRAAEEKKRIDGFWFVQDDLWRREQDLRFFRGYISGYDIAAAAILRTGENDSVHYQMAYSVCSPHDKFDWTKAKRYLGRRIQSDCEHPYRFGIALAKKGALKSDRLAQMIRNHIEADAITGRVPLPRGMTVNATVHGTRKFTSQMEYVDIRFTLPQHKKKRKVKKDENKEPNPVREA